MDAVELLATEKLSGGGRVDKSGESARRAARRSLSLAVKAAAIIGSVSRGPANLKNSCEFLFSYFPSLWGKRRKWKKKQLKTALKQLAMSQSELVMVNLINHDWLV